MKTLTNLNDAEVLTRTKDLVKQERELLNKVLHHLSEVERRKLFVDLGYQSLFEYCIKELGYSEGQVSRRISAMRLMRELPGIEPKIVSGSLSLSNISKAHKFFKITQQEQNHRTLAPAEKLIVLEALENKSFREADKVLDRFKPQQTLAPADTSIVHFELHLQLNSHHKEQWDEFRTLLGNKAYTLNESQLFAKLLELGLSQLKQDVFGKKRLASVHNMPPLESAPQSKNHDMNTAEDAPQASAGNSAESGSGSKNPRYVSKALRFQIHRRDRGQCQGCGSKGPLQVDHIHPVALGGQAELENLRLLCHNCNQRQRIKTFGLKDYGG